MLTIAKLSRWSINYYNDTARAAGAAAADVQRAGGGLGEYYAEHDTRIPVWLCAGDTHAVAKLVGLTDIERAGGTADPDVVQRWLDDGETPNGACGRAFGNRGVHGFDLTFCAPKSVSLIRAIRAGDVADKAITAAHATSISEAMEYLAAHAGYTRVHNPATGEKDLLRLPGLAAIAYQHETSRAGDPHLHTHVIVPNRQARADGQLVSTDGTSLYHEAKAAGVIYQATLRRELHQSLGVEWLPVDAGTGMAEVAGIAPESVTAWSQRSTQLREWAAGKLTLADGEQLSPAQLGAAQKATRPSKPEQLSFAVLRDGWRTDERGLRLDDAARRQARQARREASRRPFDRRRLAAAAEQIEKAAFTRADLVEIVGAQLPVDTEQSPRELVEDAVDEIGIRLSTPRQPHQREGHERFTLDRILAEEAAVLDLVDAQDPRSEMWVTQSDTEGLSPDQKRAVENIAVSPWLVQPLSAAAGAGKTTSLRALAAMARHSHGARVFVLAPTGAAVDVAVREGAGDVGCTVAKALRELDSGTLTLGPFDLVVVDEAAMVGTDDLWRLLKATTTAKTKAVLVGDAHQLAPVKARGGMFAQLCADLPWSQKLSEVWRMRDPEERSASLALRDGGPAPVRRAVDWYSTHDRLHTGDAIVMAADALAAYQHDVAAGKNSLLLCDTTEMTDALNHRIHRDTIGAEQPTVTAARGHRIAVGDLIISRRNDPTLGVFNATNSRKQADPVRNGNRWRIYAVDPKNNRIAARRLHDGARAAFTGDYLREHITYGYATTVHSAQGITADTTHAVLGENTTRALLYVALTRGRDNNTAYLHERIAGESEHSQPDGVHILRRGTAREAAQLARSLIANHDEQPRTAYRIAQDAGGSALPEPVRNLLRRHADAIQHRNTRHQRWREAVAGSNISDDRTIDEHTDLSQSKEVGYETSL
ncbi:AAA family ATPase [Mycobacterium asiaticum]|uniref:MobF family relaxase n=1 Tax=Mycobacterium asiaticum TaxID=1790 RepID=UPI0007F0082F|nr:MobF family relaxase [Mycobacterium asiaticum]OBK95344.1 AAA family ATPase [Mycobacterium asiaticum]